MSVIRFFDGKLRLLPGVTIPVRSMFIDGPTKILVSPIGTPEEAEGVGTSLTALVSPTLLHHLHLDGARTRFHPAAIWGPSGLAEKKPVLGAVRAFGDDPWPYAHELDLARIEGAPGHEEVAFFHRASKTLFVADLFFNIRGDAGFLTPLTFRMMGIYRHFAMAKMWRHWVKDRAAFQRSLDKLLGWDFDRVVVSHGDIVTENARATVTTALAERGFTR